jgi:hypothetical protein
MDCHQFRWVAYQVGEALLVEKGSKKATVVEVITLGASPRFWLWADVFWLSL